MSILDFAKDLQIVIYLKRKIAMVDNMPLEQGVLIRIFCLFCLLEIDDSQGQQLIKGCPIYFYQYNKPKRVKSPETKQHSPGNYQNRNAPTQISDQSPTSMAAIDALRNQNIGYLIADSLKCALSTFMHSQGAPQQ